jgi:osmotically-inducible protein OsmY
MNKLSVFVAVAALSLLAGCTPEGRQDISEGASKVGEGLKKDAETTGKVLKDEGAKAKQAADNALMNTKVKDALNQVKDIDSSKINVDTDMDKVIHLKGSVPTEEQKSKAKELADRVAVEGYTVKDELTVAAASPSKTPSN